MADFSKQWCELNDQEMSWDFDILEEADKLEHNQFIPMICEGFGFVAIGKDDSNEIFLAVPMDDDTVMYKPYSEVIK